MTTKYPEKFLMLIEKEDMNELHKYFSKNQDKTQNIALYTRGILEKKSFDFYLKSCLDWNKKTAQTEEIFVEYALKHYIEIQDANSIQVILNRGYKLEDYNPLFLLNDYMDKRKSEENKIYNNFKAVNWKKVFASNPYTFNHFIDMKELDLYLDIVGEKNIPTNISSSHLLDSIDRCDKSVLNKLIEMGAEVFDENGLLIERLLKMRVMYPQKGMFGVTTATSRKHITDLIKDKSQDNPQWVYFIERSMKHVSDSFVSNHVKTLIKKKLFHPDYTMDEKKFWPLLLRLDNEDISSCMAYYKSIGIKYDAQRSALICKTAIYLEPEKIQLLVDYLDVSHFLKSDYVKSIKNHTGFTKKQDLSKGEVESMSHGITVLNSVFLSDKLNENLNIEQKKENPIKRMKI